MYCTGSTMLWCLAARSMMGNRIQAGPELSYLGVWPLLGPGSVRCGQPCPGQHPVSAAATRSCPHGHPTAVRPPGAPAGAPQRALLQPLGCWSLVGSTGYKVGGRSEGVSPTWRLHIRGPQSEGKELPLAGSSSRTFIFAAPATISFQKTQCMCPVGA